MKIRLAIERDLTQIGPLGECVKNLCAGESSTELAQIELAVSEVLTNIIKHSVPDESAQIEFPVGVTVIANDDILTLSVSEVGKPMCGDLVQSYTDARISMPESGKQVLELPESGWGMQLLKTLCDEISYERRDDSNILHLCFELKAA